MKLPEKLAKKRDELFKKAYCHVLQIKGKRIDAINFSTGLDAGFNACFKELSTQIAEAELRGRKIQKEIDAQICDMAAEIPAGDVALKIRALDVGEKFPAYRAPIDGTYQVGSETVKAKKGDLLFGGKKK